MGVIIAIAQAITADAADAVVFAVTVGMTFTAAGSAAVVTAIGDAVLTSAAISRCVGFTVALIAVA